MNEWKVAISEEEIDHALEEAKSVEPRPSATSATYDARLDLILVHTDDGRRLVIPREELQGLERATPEQLADIQIFALGQDIAWPQLDVDHYLPHLLEGRYATEKWKAEHRPGKAAA